MHVRKINTFWYVEFVLKKMYIMGQENMICSVLSTANSPLGVFVTHIADIKIECSIM